MEKCILDGHYLYLPVNLVGWNVVKESIICVEISTEKLFSSCCLNQGKYPLAGEFEVPRTSDYVFYSSLVSHSISMHGNARHLFTQLQRKVFFRIHRKCERIRICLLKCITQSWPLEFGAFRQIPRIEIELFFTKSVRLATIWEVAIVSLFRFIFCFIWIIEIIARWVAFFVTV